MIIPIAEQPLALAIFASVGGLYALIFVVATPYVGILPSALKYALYFVIGLMAGTSYLLASHLLWNGVIAYYTMVSFVLGAVVVRVAVTPLEKRVKKHAKILHKKLTNAQNKRKREKKQSDGNNKERNNEQKRVGIRKRKKGNPNNEVHAMRRKEKRELVKGALSRNLSWRENGNR